MEVTIILNDAEYDIIQATSILCKTLTGELEILSNHADGFFILKNESIITISKTNNETKKFVLKTGMVTILEGNKATITTDGIQEI